MWIQKNNLRIRTSDGKWIFTKSREITPLASGSYRYQSHYLLKYNLPSNILVVIYYLFFQSRIIRAESGFINAYQVHTVQCKHKINISETIIIIVNAQIWKENLHCRIKKEKKTKKALQECLHQNFNYGVSIRNSHMGKELSRGCILSNVR